jgi:4-amino-4-deoxy-L-arabinose transferase-like glycosyltransferase
VWRIVSLFFFAGTLSSLLIAALPYTSIKSTADIFARDGDLEILTPARFYALRPGLWVAGALFLVSFLLWVRFRHRSQSLVNEILWQTATYPYAADFHRLANEFLHIDTHRRWSGALLVITLWALVVRLLYLNQPMQYDEAYTVVSFAQRPLWNAISDYHLPNNHVLHTLFVHLSINIFGLSEWTSRLPAFLAGILSIPVVYGLTRRIYNSPAALLAATWVGFAPVLIDFSANARGYTLQNLFVLLAFWLAIYLRQARSLLGWLGLSLVTALGFYTIPTMLYGAGWVYAWLALVWILGKTSPAYPKWRFPLFLAGSAFMAGMLTLILYAPVLFTSGAQALFANRHVVPLSWYEFSGNIPVRLISVWQFFTAGWPLWLNILFVAGMTASMVLPSKNTRMPVHLAWPGIVWISLVLMLQRVAPVARIWLFVLPVLAIFASGGLVGGFDWLLQRVKPKVKLGVYLMGSGIILLSLVIGMLNLKPLEKQVISGPVGEAAEAAQILDTQIQPGDMIAGNPPAFAPLRYYGSEMGWSPEIFFDRNTTRPFNQVILIVERDTNLDQELRRLGLQNKLNPQTAEKIGETESLVLLRISPMNSSSAGD